MQRRQIAAQREACRTQWRLPRLYGAAARLRHVTMIYTDTSFAIFIDDT